MKFLRNIVSRPTLVIAGGVLLLGCSAVPIKMQCSEIEARINYQDLSEDQLRFAKDELEECMARHKQAEAKDSGFVEGAENRFTPQSEVQADSTVPGRVP